jgi:non-ribosomal peptide synthetase component E (peptide arylation enzyme)
MPRAGVRLTEADVVAACRAAGLPRFKTPSRVDVVAELPRNAMGKVQKTRLRKDLGHG